MSAKHFIHDPTHLVNRALQGVTHTNPAVALDAENKVIYARPSPATARSVSLVSGGGAGHEPSFAAFVGRGMLAAAVSGTIFASPNAEQIRRCILKRVERQKGVLVIVMNYTGDVLNFGMAVEKARASGTEAEMVVVSDDVGVGRQRGGKVGRRGIAGTVLVQKIAGALAAKGASLKEVTDVARLVCKNLASIGASLAHVHVPGRVVTGPTDEDLKDSEVEIGMGIHNEAGSERKEVDFPSLVKNMLSKLLDPTDTDRSFISISEKDETVLLVNNLGGVSPLEMGGITAEVVEQLEANWKIKPVRILSGTFMTSLNGLGFSVSLLKVTDTGLGSGNSILELLDDPAEAPGWSAAIPKKTWEEKPTAVLTEEGNGEDDSKPSNLKLDSAVAKKALEAGLKQVIAAEPDITNYDTIVGDGDCGIGLRRGAEALLNMLETTKTPDDAGLLLHDITHVVEKEMDGTSGAIYAIFLNALSHGLRIQADGSSKPVTPEIWAKALQTSLDALAKYTPARPGDRTLVDALYPFVETLGKTGDVKAAAKAAEDGANGTKGMHASLGRSVYIGGSGYQQVPDPGAHGLSQFLTGLSDSL
ncbi:dihydroxyacetone kinase [Diplodia corticola]|uniref:Dihydroxyacetone kinase n=1 Tax=Diplodia corticola TaxID=236234 RepID=A0A1J9QYU0_9PEZI|nr:dihydroxyacetone kinase [Diplodia corticola]OJD34238.1 dihydroxyacetone kinase [Diplodia corticola]